MEWTKWKAFTGLVALSLAVATPALAQDTTAAGRTPQPGQNPADTLTMPGQGGAADTAGFSGMERNDPTGARAPGARTDTTGGVETGAARTDSSERQAPPADASKQAAQVSAQPAAESRDPNGFKWTEPDAWAKAGQTPPAGATDAVQQKQPKDSLTMPGQGGAADTAGYSGMERDTTHHKSHKAEKSDSTQR